MDTIQYLKAQLKQLRALERRLHNNYSRALQQNNPINAGACANQLREVSAQIERLKAQIK
jgi:hypothetical protein